MPEIKISKKDDDNEQEEPSTKLELLIIHYLVLLIEFYTQIIKKTKQAFRFEKL